jgi:IPT/TIG domain
MRKLLLFILTVVSLEPLHAADVHNATPPDEFLARIHAGLIQETLGRVVTDAEPAPLSAKTFNITAKQFEFDVSPSPFIVNVGDNVTLNISVPSNDGSGSFGHGFFLETYFEPQTPFLINRGQTRQVTFVANSPGTFTYICSQSSCGSGHSLMNGTFTVNATQAAPPTISSINPSSGTPNGGNLVTITGANFVNGATVKFDTSNGIGTTVNSSTSITVTAPAHAAGTVTVTVTNPDNQSGTSSYTYVNPTLSVSSVSPSTGTTSGGTSVTISGTNFQSGATVTFGARNATNVNVVNATTITATTPLGPATQQLAVDATVMNPDNKSATLTGGFTYALPVPPTIIDISPAISTTVGGTTVTIKGTGFTTALTSTVTFGGVAVTNVTILDSITLIAVLPPHPAGAVDVVVHVGSASATKTNGFTYFTAVIPPHRRSVKH